MVATKICFIGKQKLMIENFAFDLATTRNIVHRVNNPVPIGDELFGNETGEKAVLCELV